MSLYVSEFQVVISTKDFLTARAVGFAWGQVQAENYGLGHDEQSSDPRTTAPAWTRGQFCAKYLELIEDVIDLPEVDDVDQEAVAVRAKYLELIEDVIDDAAYVAWTHALTDAGFDV